MLIPENPKLIAFRGTARFSADNTTGKAARNVASATMKNRRHPANTASAYPTPARTTYPATLPAR